MTSNGCDYLQYDLDNVYPWATTNNMVFNDGKFQHISYHHQSKPRSENHIYLSPSLNTRFELLFFDGTVLTGNSALVCR